MVEGRIENYAVLGTEGEHYAIRLFVMQESKRQTTVDALIPKQVIDLNLLDKIFINCSPEKCSVNIVGVEQAFKRIIGYEYKKRKRLEV